MDQHNLWAGFQIPRRLAADGETLTDHYGRFSAQPIERGFGTTLGKSLRRALLSSIEGAAITAVKIEGVEHEFSSIKGVVEDATDVILNLKQVPFTLHGNESKTLTISKTGPGEVTAADIQGDGDVEILNPGLHIATLSGGGSLKIEMRIKRGRGYVSADRNFDEDLSLGYIPIDSVHTPVKKVNYAVDATRLGEDTEYDKLTIDVWTDGSIKPDDAIGLAAKLIKDHMAIFINFDEDTEDYSYQQQKRVPLPKNDQLDRSVNTLELSVRAHHRLRNAGINTIRDLVHSSEDEILVRKNFGRELLGEVRDSLREIGLEFGMQFDEQGNPIAGSHRREAEGEIDFVDDGDGHLPTNVFEAQKAEAKAILKAIRHDSSKESLRVVREVIQEESTARRYVSQRYRTLINRKYLGTLSPSENDELDGLRATLDEMDKPYYESIIGRLSQLVRQRSTQSKNKA